MPMIAGRGRESDGEWHIPQPSPLRCRHLTVPVGSLDADLPFAEIDVSPLERDHLATPKARLHTQEPDEVRRPIDRARRYDESFVFVEVVERPRCLRYRQKRDRARHAID